MKKMRNFSFVLIVVPVFLFTVSVAFGDFSIKGYMKRNGTYAGPYHKTSLNHTILHNQSTYPNINHNTGKQGTVQPYKNINNRNHNNSGYGGTRIYHSRRN